MCSHVNLVKKTGVESRNKMIKILKKKCTVVPWRDVSNRPISLIQAGKESTKLHTCRTNIISISDITDMYTTPKEVSQTNHRTS
jgi:hypothetical protein